MMSSASSSAAEAGAAINYGKIISAIQAHKMADLSTITASSTISFALMSDVKANGNATALDLQHFVPDLGACELVVAPWAVMQPTRLAAGIALDVTIGYGDTALDVPEPLRQAMRLLIAHWYENRGLVVTGAMSLAALPATVAALIAPYRMVSL